MNLTKARNSVPIPADTLPTSNLARGVVVIEEQLATLSGSPGVYRMQDAKGDALYVGKARNLKKRVVAYTKPVRLPARLQRMIALTVSMEIITTHTEAEALLLEANLIKKLKPRYNILLRDDKSFPYILITEGHDYAQVLKHRGARGKPGRYFGPFASAGAVNRTITALQRAFLLRNCSDHIFAARTRPCLQYQIKRCSAPCVGKVPQADYAAMVNQAHEFLSGRSRHIQEMLGERMQKASEELDFERAAQIRDRIRALTQVQARQDINISGVEDADVIAASQDGGQCCIQVFFFRGGRNYGNRAYFPSHHRNADEDEVLTAFIGQFYERSIAPKLVLLSHTLKEQSLIGEALTIRAGHRVHLAVPSRGARRNLIDHASTNARDALARRIAESVSQRELLNGLAEKLGLEASPDRIEVYDNSHIQGENAVGGMIVSGPEGFVKNAYRKFNIRSEVAVKSRSKSSRGGDDYEMMREVLTRRFSRTLKEDPDRSGIQWPDLVILDGGKGQLSVAEGVFADLGIDDVWLLAVSKGPDRNAGREQFHMIGRQSFMLPPRDPVLHYLQRLRDEAHRFAIGSHRARRKKAISASPLDEIVGIGAKRKKALLMHFGSAKAISEAGLADLEAVEGISKAVAEKIYGHFHSDG